MIQGTLSVQHYDSGILRLHVLPLLRQHPGTVFQQDNVRPHATCVYGLPASCWGPPIFPQTNVCDQLRPSVKLRDSEGQLQLWADFPQERIQQPYHIILLHHIDLRPAVCPYTAMLFSTWADIVITEILSHDLSPRTGSFHFYPSGCLSFFATVLQKRFFSLFISTAFSVKYHAFIFRIFSWIPFKGNPTKNFFSYGGGVCSALPGKSQFYPYFTITDGTYKHCCVGIKTRGSIPPL